MFSTLGTTLHGLALGNLEESRAFSGLATAASNGTIPQIHPTEISRSRMRHWLRSRSAWELERRPRAMCRFIDSSLLPGSGEATGGSVRMAAMPDSACQPASYRMRR